MRHPIDPKIDCVFKALLGSEDNRGLSIHFLNAMLGAEWPGRVIVVEILNRYNEREFLSDKLKHRRCQGARYRGPGLPGRDPVAAPCRPAGVHPLHLG